MADYQNWTVKQRSCIESGEISSAQKKTKLDPVSCLQVMALVQRVTEKSQLNLFIMIRLILIVLLVIDDSFIFEAEIVLVLLTVGY